MDPIFGLFVQLHWVVNYLVLIGLLLASVWVWAIAIDKLFLFSRTRRDMDSSRTDTGRIFLFGVAVTR